MRPELLRHRPAVGLAPKLSDSELICLAVVQALLGFTSEARFRRHANDRPGHLFHYLPNQSGYNNRLRRAGMQLRALIRVRAEEWESWFDDTCLSIRRPASAGARVR